MKLADLLKQKTTWAGLAMVITGVGELVTGGSTSQGLQAIITGLGLIFLRQAIAKSA